MSPKNELEGDPAEVHAGFPKINLPEYFMISPISLMIGVLTGVVLFCDAFIAARNEARELSLVLRSEKGAACIVIARIP
jgi:hypothetical protein